MIPIIGHFIAHYKKRIEQLEQENGYLRREVGNLRLDCKHYAMHMFEIASAQKAIRTISDMRMVHYDN